MSEHWPKCPACGASLGYRGGEGKSLVELCPRCEAPVEQLSALARIEAKLDEIAGHLIEIADRLGAIQRGPP